MFKFFDKIDKIYDTLFGYDAPVYDREGITGSKRVPGMKDELIELKRELVCLKNRYETDLDSIYAGQWKDNTPQIRYGIKARVNQLEEKLSRLQDIVRETTDYVYEEKK